MADHSNATPAASTSPAASTRPAGLSSPAGPTSPTSPAAPTGLAVDQRAEKQYNPPLAPIFTFRPSQPTELPKRRGGRPYKRAGASTPGHTPSLTPNPTPASAPTPIQDRETLDYGAFLTLVARGDLKRAYEGAVQ